MRSCMHIGAVASLPLRHAVVLRDVAPSTWTTNTVNQSWAVGAARNANHFHALSITNALSGTNDIDLCIGKGDTATGNSYLNIISTTVETTRD